MKGVDEFYEWYAEDQKFIEENGERKKRGRKATKNYYFTYVTQNAIVAYNNETDAVKKNRVFEEHINYPLNKLVENVYYTYGFTYFDVPYEDVQAEVVAFLTEKLDRYTEDKGKAYSYFTVVARNYLIIQNNANYDKLKGRAEIDEVDQSRNINTEMAINERNDSLRDFTDLWCNWYDTNLEKIFSTKRDLLVADTIIELFRQRALIENFNKKALYILIRERTNLKTQNITKVIGVMKKDFFEMYDTYNKTGQLVRNP